MAKTTTFEEPALLLPTGDNIGMCMEKYDPKKHNGSADEMIKIKSAEKFENTVLHMHIDNYHDERIENKFVFEHRGSAEDTLTYFGVLKKMLADMLSYTWDHTDHELVINYSVCNTPEYDYNIEDLKDFLRDDNGKTFPLENFSDKHKPFCMRDYTILVQHDYHGFLGVYTQLNYAVNANCDDDELDLSCDQALWGLSDTEALKHIAYLLTKLSVIPKNIPKDCTVSSRYYPESES